jgi:glycerophosphoryl diester phosphodiesterase
LAPEIRTASRASLMGCLTGYIGYGWTGALPADCRNVMMLVPINYAPWLWGWPDRFLNRMQDANTLVFVIGPYHGGGFSTGIDSAERFAQLPANYSGGIWTNEIETVADLVK